MRKSIIGRMSTAAIASAALLVPAAALAPTAAAVSHFGNVSASELAPLYEGESEMREGQNHEGPDFITQFEMRIDVDGNVYCVDIDENVMEPSVMDENCRLDRSHLARGPIDIQPKPPTVIETGPGYQNVTTLGADISFEDLDLNDLIIDHPEIETGEGFQNIVPLGGGLDIGGNTPVGIEPISAPVDTGMSALAITGIVAGSVVVLGGGAALYVLKTRRTNS